MSVSAGRADHVTTAIVFAIDFPVGVSAGFPQQGRDRLRLRMPFLDPGPTGGNTEAIGRMPCSCTLTGSPKGIPLSQATRRSSVAKPVGAVGDRCSGNLVTCG